MRTYHMRMSNRFICVLLTAVFLSGIISGVLSGCDNNTERPSGQSARYSSYRDIPGVTEEDIEAIEALQKEYETFIVANVHTTDAFYDRNGDMRGYMPLFCGWLTEMFGIKFEPANIE